MRKKGGWFSSVKKALNSQSKKDQKTKSKKNRNEENRTSETGTAPLKERLIGAEFSSPTPPPPPPPPPVLTKSNEININGGQNKRTYSIAIATTAATEVDVVAAQAVAEVVSLTTVPRVLGKSKEEVAAIIIQTAFRGYLARRAIRAFRGLVRLKSLIDGQSVKRQVATTLRCMQTLAHVQSQIRARRVRMSEENLTLQRQLQQKHEKKFENLRMGETWDDSPQSKEQMEANLKSKHDAVMRRERALAYAFTHQQPRKNNKKSNLTFMDPNNPQWGWSWFERWMAVRPWESRSMPYKESHDHGSVKSFRTLSVAGEINRAYAFRDLSDDNNKPSLNGHKSSQPTSRQSPSNLLTYLKPNGRVAHVSDEDRKSTMSNQSKPFRRHSVGVSSFRDDERLTRSQAMPSYMAANRSAKAQTKPLGATLTSDQKPPLVGSTKKRLSFTGSTSVLRRHSVPRK